MICISASIGVTALLLWKSQANLPSMGKIAAGYLLAPIAFASMTGHGPHVITVQNALVMLSQCLIADGMMAFFGRRVTPWPTTGLVAFTALFWYAVQEWDPNQVQIRVVAATALLTFVSGRVVLAILRSDNTVGIARNFVLAYLCFHMAVLVARAVVSLVHPDPRFVLSDQMKPLFFLEFTILHTLFFCGILIIVGTHLVSGLQRQAERLATEQRMKAELRQFLHILGHELRTPLAVIDRAVEMVEVVLPSAPPEVSRRLTTVRDTVARVDEMIDNLLTAERAGLEEVQHERLSLGELVADAMATLAEKHGPRRLRLDCDGEAVHITGHRGLLYTAAINLLDNALKYSPANTPVTAAIGVDGGMAMLAVRDHGIGIPPHQIDKVGERFFRADNAKALNGTGLGVHIVQTVAARHGGHLELRNAPDGGTLANLYLRMA